ncbi:hypothetical protein SESBI_39390 [Sesbania bispinosa]|nr:hypothetical protein SESBI_39390 [Sesbania bispinosa]
MINPRDKRGRETLTSIDNVTVSSDVVEGLRTVLFDPRKCLGAAGRVTSDEDTFALIWPRRVSLVVGIDVHRRDRLRQ